MCFSDTALHKGSLRFSHASAMSLFVLGRTNYDDNGLQDATICYAGPCLKYIWPQMHRISLSTRFTG
jgi:hypothetical protein